MWISSHSSYCVLPLTFPLLLYVDKNDALKFSHLTHCVIKKKNERERMCVCVCVNVWWDCKLEVNKKKATKLKLQSNFSKNEQQNDQKGLEAR